MAFMALRRASYAGYAIFGLTNVRDVPRFCVLARSLLKISVEGHRGTLPKKGIRVPCIT